MSDDKSHDLLGLAPYGKAVNTLAKGTVAGASAFLSRICLPAAEEFGLLVQDKIRAWRGRNATEITLKAERIVNQTVGSDAIHAHPRLVAKILDEGSWTDDDSLQNMWAGLLATSCGADGNDEGNLIFVNLLSQLTSSQVRILDFACVGSLKYVTANGFLAATNLRASADDICAACGVTDLDRVDRELDHLRALGLIGDRGGFDPSLPVATADITPALLALQLYARCKGHRGASQEFYQISRVEGPVAIVDESVEENPPPDLDLPNEI